MLKKKITGGKMYYCEKIIAGLSEMFRQQFFLTFDVSLGAHMNKKLLGCNVFRLLKV